MLPFTIVPWLCLPLLAASGCASRRATAAAEEVLRTTPERAILIECREDFRGDDRSWFIAVPSEKGATAGGSAEGTLVIADGGDSVEAAFEAWFTACKDLSDRAFDTVAEQGIPEAWELSDTARKWHLFVPNAELSRAIVVSVIGSFDRLIDLPNGAVRAARSDESSLLRRIGSASAVTWSGDGTRLAFSPEPSRDDPRENRLFVLEVGNGQVLHDLGFDDSVEDIAWSPDGTRLAVLCGAEHLGTGPLESLGAAIGHGVPYLDFKLLVVDLATGEMWATPLAEDVQYGHAFVLWDRRAVRSMEWWIDP